MATTEFATRGTQLSGITQAVLPIWRSHIEQCLRVSSSTVVDLLVSFFAVADDLIQAISRSEGLNKGLQDQLDSVMRDVEALRPQATDLDRSAGQSHQALYQAVGGIFQSLLELTSASQSLASLHARVRQNLDQILVALQHEDRMSQILNHVCDDMGRLEAMLAAPDTPLPDPEVWLDTLRASYTTPEERAVHDGNPDGKTTTSAGIDFF